MALYIHSPFFVQCLPLLRKHISVRLALDTPDPKRQRFESSLTSEATLIKVNVSYTAFIYTQVLGHRLRWEAPCQGLPICLGLRELQQLKDHPDKACVSWWCVHQLQRTSLSFHCTQPNYTIHYSTTDDVVGLLSTFEKGAMIAEYLHSEWFQSSPLNGISGF